MAPEYDEETAILRPIREPTISHVSELNGGFVREWRGTLCECLAGCDVLAWGACALSQTVPCVLYG